MNIVQSRGRALALSVFFSVGVLAPGGQAQQIDARGEYRLTTQWQGDSKSLHADSSAVTLAPSKETTAQMWKLIPIEGGFYRLASLAVGRGRSLDVVNLKGKTDLRLAKSGRVKSQHWKLTPLKGGFYRITSRSLGEGFSLDVVNDGKNNRLRMAKTGKVSGQLWKLTPVRTKAQTMTQSAGDAPGAGADPGIIVTVSDPIPDASAPWVQHYEVAANLLREAGLNRDVKVTALESAIRRWHVDQNTTPKAEAANQSPTGPKGGAIRRVWEVEEAIAGVRENHPDGLRVARMTPALQRLLDSVFGLYEVLSPVRSFLAPLDQAASELISSQVGVRESLHWFAVVNSNQPPKARLTNAPFQVEILRHPEPEAEPIPVEELLAHLYPGSDQTLAPGGEDVVYCVEFDESRGATLTEGAADEYCADESGSRTEFRSWLKETF